jgi:hypothetical protein
VGRKYQPRFWGGGAGGLKRGKINGAKCERKSKERAKEEKLKLKGKKIKAKWVHQD